MVSGQLAFNFSLKHLLKDCFSKLPPGEKALIIINDNNLKNKVNRVFSEMIQCHHCFHLVQVLAIKNALKSNGRACPKSLTLGHPYHKKIKQNKSERIRQQEKDREGAQQWICDKGGLILSGISLIFIQLRSSIRLIKYSPT